MISRNKGWRYVLFLSSAMAFFGAVLTGWRLFGLASGQDYDALPIILSGTATGVALLFTACFFVVYRRMNEPPIRGHRKPPARPNSIRVKQGRFG